MCHQCDQIRLFLKGLGGKFSCKCSPNNRQLFKAILKVVVFMLTLLWGLFGQVLKN